jgi:hypothetical protein
MIKSAIAALFAAGILWAAPAEDLPKGETILDHYIEVTGGKEAYAKIHSELTKGAIEFVGKNIKGTIVSYHQEPNKDYTVADIAGVGKVESGSDGDVLWERSALQGARVKSGEEREEALRVGTFNPHLNWRKMYDTAETQGVETVDGAACYKVLLTPRSGSPETQFYDKKTGLLVKSSSVHKTQMGDIPAESFAKDYKPVAGVSMPFTMSDRFAGQEIRIVLSDIQVNPEIEKNRFDLPDDIKALLRKNGAPANEVKTESKK